MADHVSPSGLAEHVCLALVAEGPTHGWALGTLLSPDGDLGRIWTLSRPLTYRALDGLAERRLVERRPDAAPSRRERTTLRVTPAGRRAAHRWLDAPVTHVRDIRTELLLKLALRRRAGLGLDSLLSAQLEMLRPALDALEAPDHADPVDRWRRENAAAVRRFLRGALAQERSPADPSRPAPRELRVSARNQLRATVDHVARGDVMATVRAVLPDGQVLTAAVTRDAVDDLGVVTGDPVVMLVKSTEILVAIPDQGS